jgi:hypothetical protein
MIGVELGLLDAATSAGLIAAGLLSVLIFPIVALTILRRAEPAPERAAPEPLPPIGAGRATLEGA